MCKNAWTWSTKPYKPIKGFLGPAVIIVCGLVTSPMSNIFHLRSVNHGSIVGYFTSFNSPIHPAARSQNHATHCSRGIRCYNFVLPFDLTKCLTTVSCWFWNSVVMISYNEIDGSYSHWSKIKSLLGASQGQEHDKWLWWLYPGKII